MRAIYAFLDCGIPENGVARVFCDGCGQDYFVAFSCRMRGVCPSCSTKRSILFGEKICGLVRPISHLHVTFTIPKILRAWFRRNRKLLKRMVQSANWAMRIYFIPPPDRPLLVSMSVRKFKFSGFPLVTQLVSTASVLDPGVRAQAKAQAAAV